MQQSWFVRQGSMDSGARTTLFAEVWVFFVLSCGRWHVWLAGSRTRCLMVSIRRRLRCSMSQRVVAEHNRGSVRCEAGWAHTTQNP
jgi:uncharacterized membrane protein YgcG